MRTLPPADLAYIEESLQSAVTAVTEAYEDSRQPPALPQSTPDLLHDSLVRLLLLLRHRQKLKPNNYASLKLTLKSPVSYRAFFMHKCQGRAENESRQSNMVRTIS